MLEVTNFTFLNDSMGAIKKPQKTLKNLNIIVLI